MKFVVFFITVLIAVVVSGGPAWKDQNVQRGSGLKIGQGGGRNSSASRGNGLKLGSPTRGLRTTSTTTMPEEEVIPTPSAPTSYDLTVLHVGMVVPYKSFGVREYTKAATNAIYYVKRKFVKLFSKYDLQTHIVMKEMTPSPTGKSNLRRKLFCFPLISVFQTIKPLIAHKITIKSCIELYRVTLKPSVKRQP